MPMTAGGIAKLVEECGELMEECGELVQVLGKRLAYYHTNEHPDGAGRLDRRIENEMGDVLAAIDLVVKLHGHDLEVIRLRYAQKFGKFLEWHNRRDNNLHGVDVLAPKDGAK